MLAQAGRLQARQRFFNLVVTNVPGPQIRLYVLGASCLDDLFPLAPLAKRQAVCIAIMSYNGKLNFGLLGDFDAMPDLENIARTIQDSLDELRVAAGVEAAVTEVAPLPQAARTTAAPQSNGAAETSSVE